MASTVIPVTALRDTLGITVRLVMFFFFVNRPVEIAAIYQFMSNYLCFFADRLAQLVEHRITVREVVGSNPGRDQHSASLNN